MRDHTIKTRRRTRFFLFITLCTVICIIAGATVLKRRRVDSRVNIVVATSPLAIWSFNPSNHSATVMTIPEEMIIQGIHGYGAYSFESLWKLGIIDHRSGLLLSESTQEELGIPIVWFIGIDKNQLTPVSDPISWGRHFFSWGNSIRFIIHAYETNMNIWSFIRLVRLLSQVSIGRITHIDISHLEVTSSEVLPDGSVRQIFDNVLLDRAIQGSFEEDSIRGESLTAAVYNTTDTPSLGTRVARLLSNIGIQVVTVGNEKPTVNQCRILTSVRLLHSNTVERMKDIYDCKIEIVSSAQRADIILRMGTRYATRFSDVR
jgi:hypothetical protein